MSRTVVRRSGTTVTAFLFMLRGLLGASAARCGGRAARRGQPRGALGHGTGAADGLARLSRTVPGPVAVGGSQPVEVGAAPGVLQAPERHAGVGDDRPAVDLERESLA